MCMYIKIQLPIVQLFQSHMWSVATTLDGIVLYMQFPVLLVTASVVSHIMWQTFSKFFILQIYKEILYSRRIRVYWFLFCFHSLKVLQSTYWPFVESIEIIMLILFFKEKNMISKFLAYQSPVMPGDWLYTHL